MLELRGSETNTHLHVNLFQADTDQVLVWKLIYDLWSSYIYKGSNPLRDVMSVKNRLNSLYALVTTDITGGYGLSAAHKCAVRNRRVSTLNKDPVSVVHIKTVHSLRAAWQKWRHLTIKS